MNRKTFDKLTYDIFNNCQHILHNKEEDYCSNLWTQDVLSNFKKGARLAEISPATYLLTLVSKHITAIYDQVPVIEDAVNNDEYSVFYGFYKDIVTEKIPDIINYMLLLTAILKEYEEVAEIFGDEYQKERTEEENKD